MQRPSAGRATLAPPHVDLRLGRRRATEDDATRSHRGPEQRRIVEQRGGTNRLQRPDIRERVVQRALEEIPGASDRPADDEAACGERAQPRLQHLTQSGSDLVERRSSALVASTGECAKVLDVERRVAVPADQSATRDRFLHRPRPMLEEMDLASGRYRRTLAHDSPVREERASEA